MYIAHYGLTAAPFAITPDPHYLYLSERHREALAHLLYGVNESSGFVLLTGEVGTGKTTLCRCLIEQLPNNVDVALLLNPRVTPLELLASLFDELRIRYDAAFTLKDFIDTLNTYLLTSHAVGRRTVLILDEAQNLSTEVLEQVRLLTNLETNHQKLLQIILVGQPELKTLLKRPNLRQLAQRITARYHLLPLSQRDTLAYINHRLAVSGARQSLFTNRAIKRIYYRSGGIPRLINIICDRALLGGYVHNISPVTTHIVNRAINEVKGETFHSLSPMLEMLSVVGLACLVVGLVWWWTLIQPPASEAQNWFSFNSSIAEQSLPVIPPPPAKPSPPIAVQPVLTPTTADSTVMTPLVQVLTQQATDIDTAYAALLRQWQLDFNKLKGKTLCVKVETQNLRCYAKTGTWKDVRHLNRPVVLELVNDDGRQHHVLLTQLHDDNTVTLEINQQTYDYPLKAVNDYWLGQLLGLWLPPEMPITLLKRGEQSRTVIWVRERLRAFEGRPPTDTPLSPKFDQHLQQRIMAFQRYHGLDIDGIIGEQTFLYLNGLAGKPPFLIAPDAALTTE